MTRYCRSLTPTIAYDTIGLSHPSYYNKTKKTNKKRTRHQIENDTPRQVSPIGKENNTNTRLKKNKPPKDIASYSRPSNYQPLSKKGRTTQGLNRNDRSLTPINSTGSTQKTQQTNKDRNTRQIQNKINNTVPI